MKRYQVRVSTVRKREFEIEANDENEAKKKAVQFAKKEGLINHKTPIWTAEIVSAGPRE